MLDETSQVSKYWGKNEPLREDTVFYTSSILRPYFIELAYGKDFIQEFQDNSFYAEDLFMKTYLNNKTCRSILSLCCGFGSIERRFMTKLNSVEHCTGLDLSPGALEVARTRAKEQNLQNITYETADLNNYPWQKNKYDLVIANGALHHLKSLEKVFEGIKYTLKPGGMLYACEYVGPTYQDYDIRQLELINACSYLVPKELRARRALPVNIDNDLIFKWLSSCYSAANRLEFPEQWPKWKKSTAKLLSYFLADNNEKLNFGIVQRSNKKYLLKTDPSEGVRSPEIIPVAKKYFSNIEVRPFGGAILQSALDANFYLNFDKTSHTHRNCLELLCSIEKSFMATNEIGIENAFIIASQQ